jgi:SOS-response transcriptional repressor LexA
MHLLQEKLLELLSHRDLNNLTLREIGELANITSPQQVKHHLLQLEKKGFAKVDTKNKKVSKINRSIPSTLGSLISLPILGTADCGPATFLADSNTKGFLKVSGRLLKKRDDVYVIEAKGSSMNLTNVDGNSIEDGDFLVIDSKQTSPKNGEIVISIIDGAANVKIFQHDKANNRIVLMSRSKASADYPPILIHEDDDFSIAGTVLQVIKKPTF